MIKILTIGMSDFLKPLFWMCDNLTLSSMDSFIPSAGTKWCSTFTDLRLPDLR